MENHLKTVRDLRIKIEKSNGPYVMSNQEWESLEYVNKNGLNRIENF